MGPPPRSSFRSIGCNWPKSSTIGFLNPIFVALLAAPVLGEKVGRAQIAAIAVGFLGVLIATRPGTNAFQPIVLLAIAGVMSNSGYVISTRLLARYDASETTLIWTQTVGVALITPILPWIWRWPDSPRVWLVMAGLGTFGALGHGLLIVAHRFAPAPVLAPFFYTQLIWMSLAGLVVFGDWPHMATLVGAALVAASGGYLVLRERTRRSRAVTPAEAEAG